jgi:hypothetical protein
MFETLSNLRSASWRQTTQPRVARHYGDAAAFAKQHASIRFAQFDKYGRVNRNPRENPPLADRPILSGDAAFDWRD